MRFIRLNQNLDRVEIKHAFKPGCETSIPLTTILRPLVPQTTMDILKTQRKISESQNSFIGLEGKCNVAEISGKQIPQRLINNTHPNIEKYIACSYYPFSVLLEKGGRIEFVAPNYSVFKEWITGLNFLVKNKKNLVKIRKQIDYHSIQLEKENYLSNIN